MTSKTSKAISQHFIHQQVRYPHLVIFPISRGLRAMSHCSVAYRNSRYPLRKSCLYLDPFRAIHGTTTFLGRRKQSFAFTISAVHFQSPNTQIHPYSSHPRLPIQTRRAPSLDCVPAFLTGLRKSLALPTGGMKFFSGSNFVVPPIGGKPRLA